MLKSLRVIFSVATLVTTSALLPINMAWGAGLVYSNLLESGFGDVDFHGGCYSYSLNIVDSPLRTGSKSARVVNKGSEDNSNCSGWAQGSKHRAEIRWGANTTYKNMGSPYWFGFSVFVPNDYPTRAQSADAVLIAQLIDGSYGPELSFQLRAGDTWELRRDWSTGSTDKGNELTHAKFTVEKGVWTDWVIYRERSWNNNGVMKIWKNGQQVVNFTGPTAINYEAHGNSGDVYLKTGIYWGTEPRPVNYTLYFDNIRTANAADGYAMVAPAGGSNLEPPATPTGVSIQISGQ